MAICAGLIIHGNELQDEEDDLNVLNPGNDKMRTTICKSS